MTTNRPDNEQSRVTECTSDARQRQQMGKTPLTMADTNKSNRPPAIPKRFHASISDYFIYLGRIISDIEFRNIFRFGGRIDAARMARAIRLTLDAEPVLGCRFCRENTRIYWERLPDLDSISLCPIIEKQDHEAELHQFLAAPLDSTAGPQVDARLFRSDSDTLGVKFSHVAGDGAGHMEYLSLLAKTYRELARNPDFYPRPNLEADRGINQVLKNVSLQAIMKGVLIFSRRKLSNISFPEAGQDFKEKIFTVRRIGPERLARIKAYSRQQQATTNDILLTAAYRALAKTLAPEAPPNHLIRPPLQVTVSLRRHLPSGQANTICNLSSFFIPDIALYPRDSFEDTVAQVRKATAAAKTDQPWLGGVAHLATAYLYRYPLAHSILRRIMRRRMIRDTAGGVTFSNIGALDTEQLSFGDTPLREFISFGTVQHLPGCLLGINAFGSELYFTMGYSAVNSSNLIEKFLDNIITELPV